METKIASIQAQLYAMDGKADALAFLLREIIQISPDARARLQEQIPKYLNQIEAESRSEQDDLQPSAYLKACAAVLSQFAELLESLPSHEGTPPPCPPAPVHGGETQNHQGVSVAAPCSHEQHQ